MFFGMPKIAKELTAIEVKRLNRPGWHAVGGVAGLLLQIRPPAKPGAILPRSWILRLRVAGKRHPIGLGSYPQLTLAEAREQARKLTLEAKGGINLVARKRAQRSALIAAAAKNQTFQDCAQAYMQAHATDYTNEKHRKQWGSTLAAYAYPVIGRILVADITMRHVLDVVLQETVHRDGTTGKLWHMEPETAKRLLDRIRTVLDYATVNEYRSGNNPAIWKGFLDTQLPSPRGPERSQTPSSGAIYADGGVHGALASTRGDQCPGAGILGTDRRQVWIGTPGRVVGNRFWPEALDHPCQPYQNQTGASGSAATAGD
jgi:hypothetical protein